MKKSIALIILLSIVTLAMVGCNQTDTPTFEQAQSDMPFADSYPALEGIAIPDENDASMTTEQIAEATIALAYRLYDTANRNDQTCDYRMSVSKFVTTVIIQVRGQLTVVKNGQEYYSLEQREGKSIVTISAQEPFGLATYAKYGMDKAITAKVNNCTVDEDGNMSSSFDTIAEEGTATMPYFCKQQPLLFEQTAQVIRPETIAWAKVEHNDTEGYYTVTMELDPNNPLTTSNNLQNLRDSNKNMKNANYTELHIEFEVWDNGFFRKFDSVDKWDAGGLFRNCRIDYYTVFYYEQDKSELAQYSYFEQMQQKAAQEVQQ